MSSIKTWGMVKADQSDCIRRLCRSRICYKRLITDKVENVVTLLQNFEWKGTLEALRGCGNLKYRVHILLLSLFIVVVVAVVMIINDVLISDRLVLLSQGEMSVRTSAV